MDRRTGPIIVLHHDRVHHRAGGVRRVHRAESGICVRVKGLGCGNLQTTIVILIRQKLF